MDRKRRSNCAAFARCSYLLDVCFLLRISPLPPRHYRAILNLSLTERRKIANVVVALGGCIIAFSVSQKCNSVHREKY